MLMRHHEFVATEREITAEEFFAGHPDALAVFTKVCAIVGTPRLRTGCTT